MNTYYVYITTNRDRKVLYTGVTNDIKRRMERHLMASDYRAFSARYNANNLLHFEEFHDINQAIAREKQIKSWSRKRKEQLVTSANPSWEFLEWWS